MRTRAIKPSFFTNEALAELPMAARLLFIGLWTMADREGRLEDRPKRIKAQVFPFDVVKIEQLLVNLESEHFIVRYEVGNVPVIWIPTFTKHQHIHPKEPISSLPAPDGTLPCPVPVREKPDQSGASAGNARANPPLPSYTSIPSGSSSAPDPGFEDDGEGRWGDELPQPLRDRVLEACDRIGWKFVEREEYDAQVQLCREYDEAELRVAREEVRRDPQRSKPFANNLRRHLQPKTPAKPAKPKLDHYGLPVRYAKNGKAMDPDWWIGTHCAPCQEERGELVKLVPEGCPNGCEDAERGLRV